MAGRITCQGASSAVTKNMNVDEDSLISATLAPASTDFAVLFCSAKMKGYMTGELLDSSGNVFSEFKSGSPSNRFGLITLEILIQPEIGTSEINVDSSGQHANKMQYTLTPTLFASGKIRVRFNGTLGSVHHDWTGPGATPSENAFCGKYSGSGHITVEMPFLITDV